jgi:hypothetical protein
VPSETGAPSAGGSSQIEVIAVGLTIRLGTGFDTGDSAAGAADRAGAGMIAYSDDVGRAFRLRSATHSD